MADTKKQLEAKMTPAALKNAKTSVAAIRVLAQNSAERANMPEEQERLIQAYSRLFFLTD